MACIQNLHKNLPNSELHNPKDFSLADNNTFLTRDICDTLQWKNITWDFPVLDFVDGSLAPPTENDGDRYVLLLLTGTSVHADWDNAAFDDIVEFCDLDLDGTAEAWSRKIPVTGHRVYDETTNDDWRYDASWTQLTGGADSDWTISGVNQFSAVSGNVGINTGTTIPRRLTVLDASAAQIRIENDATLTYADINMTGTGILDIGITGYAGLSFGNTITVSGDKCIGLGNSITLDTQDGIAIGQTLNQNGGGESVLIGKTVTGNSGGANFLLGRDQDFSGAGIGSVGIGFNQTSTGSNIVCIGANAETSGIAGIAIGRDTLAAAQGVCVGDGSTARASDVVIGRDVDSTGGSGSLLVGHFLESTTDRADIIGHGLSAADKLTNTNNFSIVLGNNSDTATMIITGGDGTVGSTGSVGIGVGDSNPTAKLQVDGSFAVKRLALVADGNSDDEVLIAVTSTAAPRTITLQTADITAGTRLFFIKDESGGAGTNNITIATQGAETIDGAATLVISTNYGAARLYSNGTNLFTI